MGSSLIPNGNGGGGNGPRNSRRGRAAISDTMLFIKDFPTAGMPRMITVTKFDLWAFKRKLYLNADGTEVDKTNADTLNRVRGQLRARINNTACSDPWINAGQVPFHIYVLSHGIDYKMADIETAVSRKIDIMPRQIKSFANGKEARIEELYGALDMPALSFDDRLKLGSWRRTVATFKHMLDFQMDLFAKELSEIVKHQGRLGGPKP